MESCSHFGSERSFAAEKASEPEYEAMRFGLEEGRLRADRRLVQLLDGRSAAYIISFSRVGSSSVDFISTLLLDRRGGSGSDFSNFVSSARVVVTVLGRLESSTLEVY